MTDHSQVILVDHDNDTLSVSVSHLTLIIVTNQTSTWKLCQDSCHWETLDSVKHATCESHNGGCP